MKGAFLERTAQISHSRELDNSPQSRYIFTGAHRHSPIQLFLTPAGRIPGDMVIKEAKPDPATFIGFVGAHYRVPLQVYNEKGRAHLPLLFYSAVILSSVFCHTGPLLPHVIN